MLCTLAAARIELVFLATLSLALPAALQQPPAGAKPQIIRGTARDLPGSIEELSTSTAIHSGSFTLMWEVGFETLSCQVPISDGRWEWDNKIADGELVWISNIIVEGSPAFQLAENPLSIQVTRKHPVDLLFYKPRQVTLDIVDAQSLKPLRNTEICAMWVSGLDYEGAQVPSTDRCSPPEKKSETPVVLPLIGDGKCYFIRAPGYAWRSFLVDHRFPGSRLVCLEPAGTVQLKPPAAGQLIDDRHHLWVTVWHEAGGARLRIASMELSNGSDPAPLENVPAGDMLIGISAKGTSDSIATADRMMRVKIAPHETTTVELEGALELATQPLTVTVRCDLDVPAELLSKDGVSTLSLADEEGSREYFAAEGTFDSTFAPSGRVKLSPRFDAIPPGDYLLGGNFPPVAIDVHVGTTDAHISQRINDCGTVRLHLSDGAGPNPDSLEWSMDGPRGRPSLPMPAVFDQSTNEWIVRAPVGSVGLFAMSARAGTTGQQDLVVAAGETRSDLKIVWESRVPIRLRDAGIPVMPSGDWWESAVLTTSTGAPQRSTPYGTSVYGFGNGEIYHGHGGDVIQLPAPLGYEKPAPIRIPEGGFPDGAKVTIDLVRKKP